MMKLLVGVFVVAVAANVVSAEMKCNDVVNTPTDWINLKGSCYHAMRTQIQTEIDASYQYLAMGAYFSRDTVNRPGFAEYFFKAAKEEREHGSKLIEYLSMRGQLTTEVSKLITVPKIAKTEWVDGVSAIQDALALETEVTNKITKLIKTCEGEPNYYHLVDYLTGVYLEEQLHGQRELAGKLATLKKMTGTSEYKSNGYAVRNAGEQTGTDALAEFLFDKEM